MEIEKVIENSANPEKAKLLGRFFKTGKGEYGQGDLFLGIMVPVQREIAKKFKNLPIKEIEKLIDSKIHEKRMIGLFILIDKYKKADENDKREIFDFYLKKANENKVNNWDLVDLSAPNIVGSFLIDKDRKILYKLVKSDKLWERRIAVLGTFAFIRHNDFQDSLKMAEMLMNDEHDLIHKAVGWMLREIGKRNEKILQNFLDKNCSRMPRTMLRYAIERLPEKMSKDYLNREI